MTPNARTVDLLRKFGWIAATVEQRLPIPPKAGLVGTSAAKYENVTRDAFGFGDILAAHARDGILLVQATSRGGVSHRIAKASDPRVTDPKTARVIDNPIRARLVTWLEAGGQFEIWGWDKPKGASRWRYRRVVFAYLCGEVGGVRWEPLQCTEEGMLE